MAWAKLTEQGIATRSRRHDDAMDEDAGEGGLTPMRCKSISHFETDRVRLTDAKPCS